MNAKGASNCWWKNAMEKCSYTRRCPWNQIKNCLKTFNWSTLAQKQIHFEKYPPPMGFTHHKAKGKGYHELNMHISWGIKRWRFLWEMKSGIDITTLHKSSKGESQLITQLPISCSLFSWLYVFPMFATVIFFSLVCYRQLSYLSF